jgi:putative phosphoribosyl transferase
MEASSVRIDLTSAVLAGDLTVPLSARGLVLFAHGSGSSRHSPRNQYVAGQLQEAGLGTLLMDLLTREEDTSRAARFDIALLADRLAGATDWIAGQPRLERLPVGYFGASTGAAAALIAAAARPGEIAAVVSRGGRPDLAADALPRVQAPTLFIVGGHDEDVLALNQAAYRRLRCLKELTVVPGATHLFEEPGTLEEVARLAAAWFVRHLRIETATTS